VQGEAPFSGGASSTILTQAADRWYLRGRLRGASLEATAQARELRGKMGRDL
jgi:hypothetical protein